MAIQSTVSQLHPTAATEECILTTTVEGMLDEFVACNKGTVDDRIRFLIKVPAGAGCGHYIFYDVRVMGNSTFSADFKDWIPKGTTMKVYSLNGAVDFTIFTHTM